MNKQTPTEAINMDGDSFGAWCTKVTKYLAAGGFEAPLLYYSPGVRAMFNCNYDPITAGGELSRFYCGGQLDIARIPNAMFNCNYDPINQCAQSQGTYNRDWIIHT